MNKREMLIAQLTDILNEHEETQNKIEVCDTASKREWAHLECLCDDIRAFIKHLKRHF